MKRIITVSRQFGSGGRSIAKAVADELGYAYYDKELINRVAEKTGFSAEYIEENGEYAPSISIFALASSYIGAPRIMGGMSAYDYLWVVQRNTILEIADQECCVILGRCADFILKDREDALHVYVHAPAEARAQRIVERYGESDKKPMDRIKDKDSKRAINYKHFTGRTWGDCDNYDLCVNSDKLTIKKSIEMIVDLARN